MHPYADTVTSVGVLAGPGDGGCPEAGRPRAVARQGGATGVASGSTDAGCVPVPPRSAPVRVSLSA